MDVKKVAAAIRHIVTSFDLIFWKRLRSFCLGEGFVLKSMLALEETDVVDLTLEGLKILNLLEFFWFGLSAMEMVDFSLFPEEAKS
jgi:hypothetical protein